MKFEELKKTFLEMDLDERIKFLSSYIEQRTNDLRRIVTSQIKEKKSSKVKDKQIKVSTEEFALLKALGLV